jgi:hypothetical protein
LRGTEAWETLLELTHGEPGIPTGENQYTKEEPENRDISRFIADNDLDERHGVDLSLTNM